MRDASVLPDNLLNLHLCERVHLNRLPCHSSCLRGLCKCIPVALAMRSGQLTGLKPLQGRLWHGFLNCISLSVEQIKYFLELFKLQVGLLLAVLLCRETDLARVMVLVCHGRELCLDLADIQMSGLRMEPLSHSLASAASFDNLTVSSSVFSDKTLPDSEQGIVRLISGLLSKFWLGESVIVLSLSVSVGRCLHRLA